MKSISNFLMVISILLLASACNQPVVTNKVTLAQAYQGKFFMGTALNAEQIEGVDTAGVAIIKSQFNSIVAENCMKSAEIQPEQGKFDFELADKFVDFGEQNNMFIIGHCLVWYQQAPDWIFMDAQGNEVSRDTLIERMRLHILTVVSRYKGRVNGWDVVNEAFEDDGSLRKTKWYNIIGEDYISLAFEFAHQADPDAELYYNDYSMPKAAKRDSVVKMVNQFKADGLRIDGIGMQAHYTLTYPDINDFADAIKAFASTGTKVMITELDISVLPSVNSNVSADISKNYELQAELNPYVNGLPDTMEQALSKRYTEFFKVLLEQSDAVSRVTVWGVNDQQSWRNYWPIKGRVDYPLLFDRHNQPKKACIDLIDLASSKIEIEK